MHAALRFACARAPTGRRIRHALLSKQLGEALSVAACEIAHTSQATLCVVAMSLHRQHVRAKRLMFLGSPRAPAYLMHCQVPISFCTSIKGDLMWRWVLLVSPPAGRPIMPAVLSYDPFFVACRNLQLACTWCVGWRLGWDAFNITFLSDTSSSPLLLFMIHHSRGHPCCQ